MLSVAKARKYLEDVEDISDTEIQSLLMQMYPMAEVIVSLHKDFARESSLLDTKAEVNLDSAPANLFTRIGGL